MAAATNRWRKPKDAARSQGLIGPNAILQLLPVIEQHCQPGRLAEMLASARIFALPDGSSMIPEGDAARLHRQLRRDEPGLAPVMAQEAGYRTADYILAHRIPTFAQALLKLLPASVSAKALSKSIEKHAWTFAGSGQFRSVDPWTFEIADNPMISGERSTCPLCTWHAAVFERLYNKLVVSGVRCTEVSCGAQGGEPVCRFVLERR